MDDSLNRFLINYINARKSMEIWKFLNLNYENNKIVNQNELLSHLRRLVYRDTIIELVKILNDRDTYADNVYGLLRKHNTIEAKNLLIKLDLFKTGFEHHKGIGFNSIVKVRNMLIAHLDPKYENIGRALLLPIDQSFRYIEKAISVLGKEEQLSEKLKDVTMRDEFNFNIKK